MTFVSLWRDARKAAKEGRPGIERRQQERLAEAVAYARVHSRYYGELYGGLPDHVTDPGLLPVTSKPELMDHFDDWVTDSRVTLEQARAFADDPELIGVDANYQPTPPGELSHTVLLSTLYRREQPILRYDLGDSVVRRPDPCPCGSPFMAIRVQGRAASVLAFSTGTGIVPLALETVVERTSGIDLYQIAQTARDTLEIRLRTSGRADARKIRESVRTDLAKFLATHNLPQVTVELTNEPPVQTAGGKYPHVIPYTSVS